MQLLRRVAGVVATLMLALLLSSCFFKAQDTRLRVGMVVDTATSALYSLNDITWEGIKRAQEDYGISVLRAVPPAATEADYLKSIDDLYKAGYKFIVLPGRVFEKVAYQAQALYEDAKFVLIDGAPHTGDYNIMLGKNLVSLYFKETEEGFVAGCAAALEQPEATFALLAYENESYEAYYYGFEQGITYANEQYSCNATLEETGYIFGQSKPVVLYSAIRELFDRNVVIYAVGAINTPVLAEAVNCRNEGKEAWVVSQGTAKYAQSTVQKDKSCVLLAEGIKRADNAVYNIIDEELLGTFPGGQIRTLGIADGCVGLPKESPSLSRETLREMSYVVNSIKGGIINVRHVRPNEKK